MFTDLKNPSIFNAYPPLEKRFKSLLDKVEMIENFPNSQQLNLPLAHWWDEYLAFKNPELFEAVLQLGELASRQDPDLSVKQLNTRLETLEAELGSDYRRFLDFKGRLEEEGLELVEVEASYPKGFGELASALESELEDSREELVRQEDPAYE